MGNQMNGKIIATFIAITVAAIALTILQGVYWPGVQNESINSKNPANLPILTVYTYDGITSEWGLGPKIFPLFESECGCKLNVFAKGDVGSFISQMIFEKNSPKADVALGFDNTFLPKLLEEDLLEAAEAKNIEFVDETLRGSDSRHFPFDWGYLAFVYDSEKIDPPKSLLDLTLPKYAKKIIIENPSTSSPGKGFLYWVASEMAENTSDYLTNLKPSLLTITPGWSEAYNLFLQGEAPIVLSYSTSPAYHIVNENTTRFKAAIFGKMYRQIEYVGIVRGAKQKELAEKFVDFMLSKKAQNEIPLGNYMYPARGDIALPEAFDLPVAPIENYPEMADGSKWDKIWQEHFAN